METDVPVAPEVKAWPVLVLALSTGLLLYEVMTGLALYFMPMGEMIPSEVLLHSGIGILLILPLVIFQLRHWRSHRDKGTFLVRILGYTGVLATSGIALSGLVLTGTVLIVEVSVPVWDLMHMVSVGLFVMATPAHLAIVACRKRRVQKIEPTLDDRATPFQ